MELLSSRLEEKEIKLRSEKEFEEIEYAAFCVQNFILYSSHCLSLEPSVGLRCMPHVWSHHEVMCVFVKTFHSGLYLY